MYDNACASLCICVCILCRQQSFNSALYSLCLTCTPCTLACDKTQPLPITLMLESPTFGIKAKVISTFGHHHHFLVTNLFFILRRRRIVCYNLEQAYVIQSCKNDTSKISILLFSKRRRSTKPVEKSTVLFTLVSRTQGS